MNPKRLGFQSLDVHFGTFDFSAHVIVGPAINVEKYVRWKLEDDDYEWDYSQARGMCFTRVGYVPIIWLPRKPRSAREIGTLAHEVLHSVRFMLVDWAGMRLNRDTDEVFCHALGMAVTSILEKVK